MIMPDESGFEMVPVSSSQIEAVGFNQETNQGKVRFLKNGSEYLYENCTQDEASQIINGAIGGSVGISFAQIWKGIKPFSRLS
jgi:KTSC domain